MPRFIKGSEEAKEHMRKIREKRGQPKPEGYVAPPKKDKKPKKEEEYVDLTTFGEPKLTIPEFFVIERQITHQTGIRKGKTDTMYKLVNPLTKTRNLSSRDGHTSIQILRKPITNNFIHLSHKPDEPIPLSLFSTKDREIIKTNFESIETHKDKPLKDIPISKFSNKTRGRPELLPKNIAVNLNSNKYPPIQFNITDETIPEDIMDSVETKITQYMKSRKYPKKPKQPPQPPQQPQQPQQIRYNIVDRPTQPLPNAQQPTQPKAQRAQLTDLTPEEKAQRLKQQKAKSAKRIYDAKRKVVGKIGNENKQDGDEEGKGIISSMTKKAKKISKKLTEYGNAVIYGRNDYSPKVRNILDQYGDKIVRGIRINRTPVPALFTHIMGTISKSFYNNLSNEPYDTLYHLYIGVSLDNGSIVSIEKNEVINMDINPARRPETEELIVIPIPPNMTILSMMEATHKHMDKKFFTYSAKNNNCQDFILGIFDANQIGDEDDRAFIKQDMDALFKNTGGLSKIADTVTNLGGAFDAFIQGAGVMNGGELFISPEPAPTKWTTDMNEGVVNKKSMGGRIKLVKGSKEAKEFMANMRAMRGKKQKNE
jgi:hypothetical protein